MKSNENSESIFFTIVVPIFNKEKYIDRCVESVLKQTFEEYEVLLIDDGSTDKSGEYIECLAKANTKLRVVHQPNGGAFVARRTGLAEGRGKYYLFLDADDVLKEDVLSLLYEKINEYQSEIIICDLDEDKRKVRQTLDLNEGKITAEDGFEEVIFGLVSSGRLNSLSTKIIHSEVVKKSLNGFCPSIRLCNSEDLLQTILFFECASTYSYIKCSYVMCFETENSTTKSANYLRFEEQLYVRNYLKEYLISHNYFLKYETYFERNVLNIMIMAMLDIQKLNIIKQRHYLKSLRKKCFEDSLLSKKFFRSKGKQYVFARCLYYRLYTVVAVMAFLAKRANQKHISQKEIST